MQTSFHWLAAAVILVSASGATCHRQWMLPFGTAGPTAPIVLTEGAAIQQIAAAINQNTSKIRSLSAPYATISIPDVVLSLRGNITLERPNRFRLTAGTGLTGQEVDLGSNEQLFWLWIKQGHPPAVYYCRHDQFAGSAAQRIMPIEPHWLQSALGLVQLDPQTVYGAPTPRNDGTLEIRSYLPSTLGNLQRVLVVDAERAWVREQHVYDATGTSLLASAVASSHRYYELERVSLPERVTIRLPPAQIALTVNLGPMQINQVGANAAHLWTMPPFKGLPQHDLGTLRGTPASPAGGVTSQPREPLPWTTHPFPQLEDLTLAGRPSSAAVLGPPQQGLGIVPAGAGTIAVGDAPPAAEQSAQAATELISHSPRTQPTSYVTNEKQAATWNHQ